MDVIVNAVVTERPPACGQKDCKIAIPHSHAKQLEEKKGE
jgi:hypothetical protein